MNNIKTYDFPQIDMTDKRTIRWYSNLNPWMDVVVVVKKKDYDLAHAVLIEAIDAYRNSDSECYGDIIESFLDRAGIEHESVYHDPCIECDEYEEAWEQYVKDLMQESIIIRKFI